MPWKECHVMDERLRFVARLLEGEKMAPLCAEFGISRKTGYKIFDRYKDCGVHGVHRSQPAAVSPGESAAAADRSDDRPAEAGVSGLGRAEDPREAAAAVRPAPHLPAISTVHAVLDRHGLVHRRRRRRGTRATGTALSRPTEPNALWCADYKGEFMLGNRRYCYPLTITDFASRYLLTLRGAVDHAGDNSPSPSSSATFKEFGLPQAIRTDNGVPVRLGARALRPEQAGGVVAPPRHSASSASSPGIPQQNGRHERMHLTLKKEATKPAAANVLQQQARFDAFVDALQPGAAAPGARR